MATFTYKNTLKAVAAPVLQCLCISLERTVSSGTHTNTEFYIACMIGRITPLTNLPLSFCPRHTFIRSVSQSHRAQHQSTKETKTQSQTFLCSPFWPALPIKPLGQVVNEKGWISATEGLEAYRQRHTLAHKQKMHCSTDGPYFHPSSACSRRGICG